VRFTPAVDDLSFAVEGKTLVVAGDFAAERPYRVTLTPAAVADVQGRPLEMTGESELWVYFPRQPSYLGWNAAQGLVERFGPQMVPPDGRGRERLGAYLVGLRRLDSSSDRSWMRVQVTDLSLTTMEEPDAVHFAVTSLVRGLPVAGASVKLEGTRENEWVTLAEGKTGDDGTF